MKQKITFVLLALVSYSWAGVLVKTDPVTPVVKQVTSFQENKGQIGNQLNQPRPDVLFSGNDGSLNFYLKKSGVSYQLQRVDKWTVESDKNSIHEKEIKVPEKVTIQRVDMNWIGSNSNPIIQKGKQLSGYDNFYTATCPNGIMNVKKYETVSYENLYSGIDLKWYTKNGQLKYDYLVDAGSDYRQIQIQFEGASKLSINKLGELEINTPLGMLTEQAPIVIQNNKLLKSTWVLKGTTVSFEIESIDASQPYVIDPLVRLWGTYYGGSNTDIITACSSETPENVFVVGYTNSTTSIATSGSFQTTMNGMVDAFIAKLDANGARVWCSYLGGVDSDRFFSCVADNLGNVYASGTSNSFLPGASGLDDACIVKMDVVGGLTWYRYFGGEANDAATECVLSATGTIFMSGTTNSTTDIATTGAYQQTLGGSYDAFIAAYDTLGTELWSSYYGGSGYDAGGSCAVDASGQPYLVGWTNSTSAIASSGAAQTTMNGGTYDGFICKFNATGDSRIWATYIGGEGTDYVYGAAMNSTGSLYITGTTSSLMQIASSLAHQPTHGGGFNDSFLSQYSGSGTQIWSTYFGGNQNDGGNGCDTDNFGNIYVAGFSESAGLSTFDSYAGAIDGLLYKFNDAGQFVMSTYYGGSDEEYGFSCSDDGAGSVYFVGQTKSTDSNSIATPFAHQSTLGGMQDGFIVKFDDDTELGIELIGVQLDGFEIFPNPSQSDVSVLIHPDLYGSQLTVYSSKGEQVFQIQHLVSGMNSFDVSTYAKGVYTVILTNGEYKSEQKLLVY